MTIHTEAAAARDEQIDEIRAILVEMTDAQIRQANELADLKATHAAEMTELKARVDALSTPVPVPEPPPVPEPEPPAPAPVPPATSDYATGCPWGTSLLTQLTIGDQPHSNGCDKCAITFVANDTSVESVKLYHIYTKNDSGYSRGDGGTVMYEIFKWDAAAGKPVGPSLGSTPDIIGKTLYWTKEQAMTKYPGAIWSQHGESGTNLSVFRRINFRQPVPTTPGEVYAVVARQTNTDFLANHISIDMLRNRRQWLGGLLPGIDGERDFLVYQHRAGEWVFRSGGHQGLVGIIGVYGPNKTKSQPYYQTSSPSQIPDPDRAANVGGAKSIRMRFKPSEAFTLQEIHLAAGRNTGSGPLNLQLKQGNQQTSIQFNGFPQLTQPSDVIDRMREEVGWQSEGGLFAPIAAGVEVVATLTAAAGDDFEVVSTQDGGNGYFPGDGWPNSLMEYTDDGDAWKPASVSKIGLMLVGTKGA